MPCVVRAGDMEGVPFAVCARHMEGGCRLSCVPGTREEWRGETVVGVVVWICDQDGEIPKPQNAPPTPNNEV